MRIFSYAIPSAWIFWLLCPLCLTHCFFRFQLNGNFFRKAFCKTPLCTSTFIFLLSVPFPFTKYFSFNPLQIIIYYSSNKDKHIIATYIPYDCLMVGMQYIFLQKILNELNINHNNAFQHTQNWKVENLNMFDFISLYTYIFIFLLPCKMERRYHPYHLFFLKHGFSLT